MRLAASRAVLHYYRAYLHPNSAFLPLTLEKAFAHTSMRRVTTRTHAVLSLPILRGCTRRKICSNGDGLFTYAHCSEPTYAFEPISQNQAMYHSVLNPSPLIRCLPFGSEKASPPEKPPLPQIKCRHHIYVAQETPDYSFNRLSEMPAIPLGLSPSFLSAFMTWVITARYAHIIMTLVYLRRRLLQFHVPDEEFFHFAAFSSSKYLTRNYPSYMGHAECHHKGAAAWVEISHIETPSLKAMKLILDMKKHPVGTECQSR